MFCVYEKYERTASTLHYSENMLDICPVNEALLGFLQQVCRNGAQNSLHHCKMLFTVMSLNGRTGRTGK